ncbi:MAG: HEAT repeat domain-containing protein [Acidobacteria bacterium]|nr:HEAT repeat domain-containing protein [Acidobacteriota bacterium]MCW5966950.1 HEAT repeat domain-containing protein [Blastocatellales bacterium]
MRTAIHCFFVLLLSATSATSQSASKAGASIPPSIHARILQLEDERDIGGDELPRLLKDPREAVRERAALALGRIGDRRATRALIEAMNTDASLRVRKTAAFALGESDDAQAIPALLNLLDQEAVPLGVGAGIVEALGKLGSLPSVEEGIRAQIGDRILRRALPPAPEKLDPDDQLFVSLTISALSRLRAAESVPFLARYLQSPHAAIRADAANALFRLRRPIAAAAPDLIVAATDADADVRANAARALGASGDTKALDPLVKLLGDPDPRVAVNAVRGLQLLGVASGVQLLISASEKWLATLPSDPSMINLLLESASALGNLRSPTALPFMQRLRDAVGIGSHQEVEVALVRLGVFTPPESVKTDDWRRLANLAAGYGESNNQRAEAALREMLDRKESRIVSAALRALSQQRVRDLAVLLHKHMTSPDVFVRSTAASLAAPLRDDATLDALIAAYNLSSRDANNDAKLSILRSLSGFKNPKAIEAVRTALSDQDHLVRRAAIEALKLQGEKTTDMTVGKVRTGRTRAFYTQIANRINRPVTATIHTDCGVILLELFAADAPLTVDNFVGLARRGFFNGIAFHRVVPNFVIQGGDPRGDGEGGPGRQIRCEINTRRYERGSLGMALSGKDTGGSQFFITHSPQPHLDGGYTVFGRVLRGQEVVDRMTRGDRIRRVVIR